MIDNSYKMTDLTQNNYDNDYYSLAKEYDFKLELQATNIIMHLGNKVFKYP